MTVRVLSLHFMLLLVVAFLGASGCSSGPSICPMGEFLLDNTRYLAASTPPQLVMHRELDKTVLPAYFVQPGDALLIEPVSYESEIRLPVDQVVLPDGTIDLGAYGRVLVAGMTVEDIELLVESRVEAFEGAVEPINVRLIDPRGAVYYVLGEVNTPGAYPLIGRETVLDAIIAAGGLSERASRCDIVLSRPTRPEGCRVVLPVCYREIVQMGDTTTNYQILPGDRLFVGTRSLWQELMFWKAKKPCSHCEWHPQCPCGDPNLAENHGPTITTLPPPPMVRLPPLTDAPSAPPTSPPAAPHSPPNIAPEPLSF